MDDKIELANIIARLDKNYGLEIWCGEGWWPIIKQIDAELSQIDPYYTVYQVKEKFGRLRYYFAPSAPHKSHDMMEVVERYSEEASKTCELTGKPGRLMVKGDKVGIFKTLCDDFIEKGWTPVDQSESTDGY